MTLKKTWRNQSSKVATKPLSVAKMWEIAFIKVENFTFNSPDSESHQLDPFNYSLTIPDKSCLMTYDPDKAILSLLGKSVGNNTSGEDDIATTYHELFHVFQSTTTKQVLDYFYLVEEIQNKRTELLKYLGLESYFPMSEKYGEGFGKSVFDCIERSHNDISKKLYSSPNNISEELKRLSDLSISDIKKLTGYFSYANDLKLHVFHLIEGSATIFGWCCAGYDTESKFLERIDEIAIDRSVSNNDMYHRSYQLFLQSSGKTPFIFVLLSTVSLTMSEPIDAFIFGLTKVQGWEADFKQDIADISGTCLDFKKLTQKYFLKISNSLHGRFYTLGTESVHDKESNNNMFIKSISSIRKLLPDIGSLDFLNDLVQNPNTSYILVDIFDRHRKIHEGYVRYSEVVRDFEKFLRSTTNDVDFLFKCCGNPKHNNVRRYDVTDWMFCEENDSFANILLDKFKIKFPEILTD